MHRLHFLVSEICNLEWRITWLNVVHGFWSLCKATESWTEKDVVEDEVDCDGSLEVEVDCGVRDGVGVDDVTPRGNVGVIVGETSKSSSNAAVKNSLF